MRRACPTWDTSTQFLRSRLVLGAHRLPIDFLLVLIEIAARLWLCRLIDCGAGIQRIAWGIGEAFGCAADSEQDGKRDERHWPHFFERVSSGGAAGDHE